MGKNTFILIIAFTFLGAFILSEVLFYSLILKVNPTKIVTDTIKKPTPTPQQRPQNPLVPTDNWEFFSTTIVPYIGRLEKGTEDRHVTLVEEFDARVNKIEFPEGKIIINMVGEQNQHLMYLRFNKNYIERGQLLFSRVVDGKKEKLTLSDLKIGQRVHFYETQDLTDPTGEGIYELIFLDK